MRASTAPRTPRKELTYVRRLAVADEGGLPVHSTSIRASEATTWFASSSSVASSSRGLVPAMRTLWSAALTCNGPRTAKVG